MTLAVISSRGQYQLLTDAIPNIKEAQVLCDNPALYDFLKENKIQFDIIDEEVLRKDWASINTWACEKALLWAGAIGDRRLLNNIEFDKALSVRFSYYLTSFLKNYLFSIYIFDKYKPHEVVIFDNAAFPHFPDCNVNYFLNLFLNDFAKNHNIETNHIGNSAFSVEKEKTSAKECMRALLQKFYSKSVVIKKNKKIFIAYGELRHLEQVLKKLKREGANIVLYNDEFRLNQLRFCIKEKIQYLTADSFFKKSKDVNNSFDYRNVFIALIKLLCSNKWFVYNGIDLSSYLEKLILTDIGSYISSISGWTDIYCKMAGSLDICGIIIDQDETADKSFMAAFFKSRKTPVFCISHGYGAVKFAMPSSNRCFDLSHTFLHSDYERALFTARGWSEKNIRVTGIPRYDRLIKLRDAKDRQKSIKPKKMTILYCGSTILDYTPDVGTYIGVAQYEFGRSMRNNLKYLIRAIEEHPIRLVIKPHYITDEAPLADFISRHRGKSDVIVTKASADFFKLLTDCQAVFMGHWSTAIMEGIIARIPTFVLNYIGIEDSFPFAQHGLCTISHDPTELKNIIEDLYTTFNSGRNSKYAPMDEGNKTFYTGLNDGLNTDRVADCIMKTVKI